MDPIYSPDFLLVCLHHNLKDATHRPLLADRFDSTDILFMIATYSTIVADIIDLADQKLDCLTSLFIVASHCTNIVVDFDSFDLLLTSAIRFGK